MPFSEDLRRLQEIALRLEQERLPLEEAMALFEEGMIAARDCRAYLKSARQRVVLLSSEDGDDVVGTPWNPEEEKAS